MTIEFADDEPTALDDAHSALAATLDNVTATVIESHKELPLLPLDVTQYGEAIELTKRGVALLTETRTLLADHLEAVKGAHTDEARGGKETMSEAAKSRLRASLAGDELYQRALVHDADLRRLLGRWDARRSRLNRDFEVARINHQATRTMDAAQISANYYTDAVSRLEQAAPQAAEAFTDALATRLRGAADYFVNKLRSAL